MLLKFGLIIGALIGFLVLIALTPASQSFIATANSTSANWSEYPGFLPTINATPYIAIISFIVLAVAIILFKKK